ncbi:MAG: hypothetical protein WBP44_01145 [Gammaproteobacteria bacterium]|jgi:hypothetical protein
MNTRGDLNCKYADGGPEKACQRYQQMAVNKSIEEMAVSYQQADNPMQAVDTMDWKLWVDWDPW